MREVYAPQYKTPCVLLDGTDRNAEQVVRYARQIGALFKWGDGTPSLVIQFPNGSQDLYTEEALRLFLPAKLIQLHWQNQQNPKESIFVAQREEIIDHAELNAWVQDVFERRKGDCPAGFIPVVYDETSEYFVK